MVPYVVDKPDGACQWGWQKKKKRNMIVRNN